MLYFKPMSGEVVCISHKEDADGIGAASLIKQAFGGSTKLVDYTNMMDILEGLKNESLQTLYICDLGLSKAIQDKFIDVLTALRNKGVEITYIDHHDIDETIKKKIESLGVNFVHKTDECTTVHVYNTYKSKLDGNSSFLASIGAITDHMEDKPIASSLIEGFDWLFTLLESTILAYIITSHQKDDEYLVNLVDSLSKSMYPHEILNAFEFVNQQARKITEAIEYIKKNMKLMSNLACVDITGYDVVVVNFVPGLAGKDVGITYKLRPENGIYVLSIRGTKSCKIHLGRLVNTVTTELGGSGGGHEKMCGGSIPKDKIDAFLKRFDSKLA